jgi:hypothetical protein
MSKDIGNALDIAYAMYKVFPKGCAFLPIETTEEMKQESVMGSIMRNYRVKGVTSRVEKARSSRT